jgi:hypothetical protein
VKKEFRISAKPGKVLGGIKGKTRAASPFFEKFIRQRALPRLPRSDDQLRWIKWSASSAFLL